MFVDYHANTYHAPAHIFYVPVPLRTPFSYCLLIYSSSVLCNPSDSTSGKSLVTRDLLASEIKWRSSNELSTVEFF